MGHFKKPGGMAKKLTVQDIDIHLFQEDNDEYFSLTDIAAKFGEPAYLVRNWLKNTGTLKFLATWESLTNKEFNYEAYKDLLDASASNSFSMSAKKWIEGTNAIGIRSRRGRHGGGSFAHSDITLNFCYWLSPEFQVYFVKEFQRLKKEEAQRLEKPWDLRREITKGNYAILTDAVREHLVPVLDWNTKREKVFFASEADLINVAVFGMTAKMWRMMNPKKQGNMRDSAHEEDLIVLGNIESQNATLIEMGYTQDERLAILSKRAERERSVLLDTKSLQEIKKLK